MTLEFFIGSLTWMATLLLPLFFTAWHMRRRSKFILRLVLSCVALLGAYLFFRWLLSYLLEHNVNAAAQSVPMYSALFLLMYILSGVAVIVCFDCNIWGAGYCANAGYCIQHITARIMQCFSEFVYPDWHWALREFISWFYMAAAIVVYYFTVTRKTPRHQSFEPTNKSQIIISVFVIGVSIIYNTVGIAQVSGIAFQLQQAGIDGSGADSLTVFVYIMSMIVAFLALALNLGLGQNKVLHDQNSELSRILEESKERYEQERSNIESINIKCHDLKHQLGALKGKVYEEQLDELKELISVYDSEMQTGNEALDTVLSQKSLYCSQHGIRLTCMLEGGDFDFIAHHELYALFCNVIDNAINAVSKLAEELRVISITQKNAGELITVCAENYFDGALEMADGLPRSNGGEGHGFGMKSIRMIAERYGGGINVTSHDNVFTLGIFLQKNRAQCKT